MAHSIKEQLQTHVSIAKQLRTLTMLQHLELFKQHVLLVQLTLLLIFYSVAVYVQLGSLIKHSIYARNLVLLDKLTISLLNHVQDVHHSHSAQEENHTQDMPHY